MQEPSRPATGYPYPYPNPNPNPNPAQTNGYPPQPQPPYPYQNPYYAPPQPNPRANFYRRLIIIFAASLLIIGVVLLIFFLVMQPRFPQFTLTAFSVTGFNITNGSQLSGNWNLQFQVKNPNKKMSLVYDEVVCSVAFGNEVLGYTRLPPFDQPTGDSRPINATVSVSGTYVEKRVVDAIGKERSATSGGGVEFEIRVGSWMWYRYGWYRGRRRYLRVFCDDVAIAGLSNSSGSGKMTGAGKECRVY